MAKNEKFCHPVTCGIKWPELAKYVGGSAAPPSYSPGPIGGDGQNIAIKEGQDVTLTMSEAVKSGTTNAMLCASFARQL